MAKKSKLPKDVNQRAVMIAQIATGEIEAPKEETDLIKLAASAMGRKGGKLAFVLLPFNNINHSTVVYIHYLRCCSRGYFQFLSPFIK